MFSEKPSKQKQLLLEPGLNQVEKEFGLPYTSKLLKSIESGDYSAPPLIVYEIQDCIQDLEPDQVKELLGNIHKEAQANLQVRLQDLSDRVYFLKDKFPEFFDFKKIIATGSETPGVALILKMEPVILGENTSYEQKELALNIFPDLCEVSISINQSTALNGVIRTESSKSVNFNQIDQFEPEQILAICNEYLIALKLFDRMGFERRYQELQKEVQGSPKEVRQSIQKDLDYKSLYELINSLKHYINLIKVTNQVVKDTRDKQAEAVVGRAANTDKIEPNIIESNTPESRSTEDNPLELPEAFKSSPVIKKHFEILEKGLPGATPNKVTKEMNEILSKYSKPIAKELLEQFLKYQNSIIRKHLQRVLAKRNFLNLLSGKIEIEDNPFSMKISTENTPLGNTSRVQKTATYSIDPEGLLQLTSNQTTILNKEIRQQTNTSALVPTNLSPAIDTGRQVSAAITEFRKPQSISRIPPEQKSELTKALGDLAKFVKAFQNSLDLAKIFQTNLALLLSTPDKSETEPVSNPS